jgi:hypothetical protein
MLVDYKDIWQKEPSCNLQSSQPNQDFHIFDKNIFVNVNNSSKPNYQFFKIGVH